MNWLFGLWGSVKALSAAKWAWLKSFIAAGAAWLAALPLTGQVAIAAGAVLVCFAIYYRKELKKKLSTSKGRMEMLGWFLNALASGVDALLNPADAAAKVGIQIAKIGATFVQFLEKMMSAGPAPVPC